MIMLTRSRLFWSVIAGLAVANSAAFLLPMTVLRLETQSWQIRAWSLGVGIAALVAAHVSQDVWNVRRGWFWGVAILSMVLFATGLWLMVAGASHDVALAAQHFMAALPNLIEIAPVWTISQVTLLSLLLSFWLAGRRLGLR